MKILRKVIVILIGIISVFSINSFATTGTINIDATRLREENNTTSEILTNIYKNEKVEILEELGEWVKIEYKDYTGYIKKEFVTIKKDSNNKDNETKKENETQKETVSNYENVNETTQNTQTTNEATTISETKLRLLPSFMSKKIQEIKNGTKLTIVSQLNNWVQVTDGTITGWILKTKLNFGTSAPQIDASDLETTNTVSNEVTNTIKENTIENSTLNNTVKNETNKNEATSVSKKGKINVETAKVRKEPSTSAKFVDFLDEGDEVSISEELDGWYKIEHGDIKGYVSAKLITIINEDDSVSSRGLTEERNNNQVQSSDTNSQVANSESNNQKESISGNQVVEFAKKYLNYPYVSGGKKPETGFDCSGFTYYVFKNFGYTLGNTASSQNNLGTEISRENLKPGDLILFYDDAKTKIGHTGIYVGNGDFIHAANPKRGVVYDNINTVSYYNERFVTARRIVK